MGTETTKVDGINIFIDKAWVKLNNPQMGTETPIPRTDVVFATGITS